MMSLNEARDEAQIELLMLVPMRAGIADALDAQFTVHKLWENSAPEKHLKAIGPRIRGVVAGGSVAIDADMIDQLPALEIVAWFGVGYDNVDVRHAADRGVVVTNTPDVLDEEVADTAVGLLIATVRQLPQGDRYVRKGEWRKAPFPLTATLRKRTVGLVGFGRIGKAIARRLLGFDVDVVYHARTEKKESGYAYYPSLIEMASKADVLVVAVPGGRETQHLVDGAVLEALGPNGILINIARGSVVDERALISALQTGTILTAGLDVFEEEPYVPGELAGMDHVVLLPHVGSASRYTRDAMGELVVENVVSWFAGKGPVTPVDETRT